MVMPIGTVFPCFCNLAHAYYRCGFRIFVKGRGGGEIMPTLRHEVASATKVWATKSGGHLGRPRPRRPSRSGLGTGEGYVIRCLLDCTWREGGVGGIFCPVQKCIQIFPFEVPPPSHGVQAFEVLGVGRCAFGTYLNLC